MKLKDLESLLSNVALFEQPKIELEQVPTSAHLASRMLYAAEFTYGDIAGCHVADLGCGTGMLSIGCHFLDALTVTSVDIDGEALLIAQTNCQNFEAGNIDFIQADIEALRCHDEFDTVIMNPPFGTRRQGIDTLFVEKALNLASTVYSLHKASTREHFVRYAKKRGVNIEILAELRYDIPKTHKFHKQKSKDIYVDLYRFSHG